MNYGFKIFFVFYLVLVCFIDTEAQIYYLPGAETNLTQYLKKGDFKLNTLLPINAKTGLQLGFSPVKHLAISIATQKQFKNSYSNFSLQAFQTSGKSYSGVVTGYLPIKNIFTSNFGPFKNIKTILFQAHLGYNKSYLKNFKSNAIDEIYIEMLYQNWFYQLGLSIKYNRFSIGYSVKRVEVDYQKIKYTGDFGGFNPLILERLLKFSEFDVHSITIPQFNIQYKFDFIEAYLTKNSISSEVHIRQDYYMQEFYEFGIIIDINQLIDKWKK